MPRLSPSALVNAWPSAMPVSSTVWCRSTSISPSAFTVRSHRLWREKSVNMWSKKGIFVAIWLRPLPSIPRSIWILVSLVRRSIWAWRLVMGLFGLLGLALLYLQENVRPGKHDHEAHDDADRSGQLQVK